MEEEDDDTSCLENYNALNINPLGPRLPTTAHSFALLRNPIPPSSGWLTDTPY